MIIRLRDWFLKSSPLKKIVILTLIAGIGWFMISRITEQKPPQPQQQTARAKRGTLITSVTASGTISQGSSTSITTQATGIVKEVVLCKKIWVV